MGTALRELKKPRIFYGWWIVTAGFFTLFISLGITLYARSVFFQAMFTDLGFGRGELALAMSIGGIIAAVLGPLVGNWIDEHGASKIMAIGAFLSGSALIASSQIHTLWQAFAIFIFSAIANVGITALPVQVTISHWFIKKRGRAIGIATAGYGMGGFVLSPLSAYLISTIGWRMAWVVLGLATWVMIIPLALLVMKPKPELLGLLPDGERQKESELSPEEKEIKGPLPEGGQWTIRKVLREPIFWMLVAVWMLFFFPVSSVTVHAYAMYTDKGVLALTAGTLVGITGLFSTLGKVTLGYLCDRIAIRYVMAAAIALFALSIFLLLVGPVWTLWLFVALCGFSWGATGISALMVVSCFGVTSMGTILGFLSLFSAVSTLSAAPATGYIFDITGSYNIALIAFIAMLIPAAVLTSLARPQRSRNA